MQSFKVDWLYVKKASWFLGAALLISGALLFFSMQRLETQQRHYQSVKAQRDQNYQQYLAAKEDALIIKQYAGRYRQLQRAGVIGEENRLDWTEVARSGANEMKLASVRLQIQPRQVYSGVYLGNVQDFTVYASRMILQLQLSHEGDFLNLFSHLNNRALGLFHINHCKLARTGEGVALRQERANIAGDCDLTWFTIIESGSEGDNDV